METQEVIMIILFAVALFYLGRMFYRNFNTKKECGSNCKCGADFSEVKLPDTKP